jgi:hypothetical protein
VEVGEENVGGEGGDEEGGDGDDETEQLYTEVV